MSNTSIWPIDRTLSGTTNTSQREPGNDENEGVLHIPPSSSITGTTPSDVLVPLPGHLGWGLTPQQRCSRCIVQHQPTGEFERLYPRDDLVSYIYIYIDNPDCFFRETSDIVTTTSEQMKAISSIHQKYMCCTLRKVYIYPPAPTRAGCKSR